MKATGKEMLVVFYQHRFALLLPGETMHCLGPFQKRSVHLSCEELDVIGRMRRRAGECELFYDFFQRAFHSISFFGGEEEGFKEMILREAGKVFLKRDARVHKDLNCALHVVERAREERRRIRFEEN